MKLSLNWRECEGLRRLLQGPAATSCQDFDTGDFREDTQRGQSGVLELEWEIAELSRGLQGVKIRSSDEELLRADPKGRPVEAAAES